MRHEICGTRTSLSPCSGCDMRKRASVKCACQGRISTSKPAFNRVSFNRAWICFKTPSLPSGACCRIPFLLQSRTSGCGSVKNLEIYCVYSCDFLPSPRSLLRDFVTKAHSATGPKWIFGNSPFRQSFHPAFGLRAMGGNEIDIQILAGSLELSD